MGTNYIAPMWRMPRNANNTPVDKLSNYSLEFDGQTNGTNIQVDNFTGLSGKSNFSISLWLKASAVPAVGTGTTFQGNVLNLTTSGTNGSQIWVLISRTSTSPNVYRLDVYIGSIAFRANISDPTTDWTNLIIAFDGTIPTTELLDRCKVWQDGNRLTNTNSANVTSVATSDTLNIGLKHSKTQWYDHFFGLMSQLAIFDYTLTDGTNGTVDQISYLNGLNNPMAITGGEPIAYYPLGDNSNPNAIAGYPNISVGADSVFQFDRSSVEYVKIDPTKLNFTDKMSFSGWAKFTSTAQDVYTVAANFDPNSGYKFALYYYKDNNPSSSLLRLRINSANNNLQTYTVNGELDVNRWYHLAFSFDGTTNANGVNLYIDNVKHSFTASDTGIYPNTTNGTRIGNYQNNNIWAMIGEISNVQFWDTNLLDSDIATLYNNGQPLLTGTQPQASNLKAWYKLNQSANWEADTAGDWQIPDNRSEYPQSFNFGDVIDNEYVAIPYQLPEFNAITVSAWIKTQKNSGTRQTIISNNQPNSIASQKGWQLAIDQAWDGSGYTKSGFFFYNSTGAAYTQIAQTSSQVLTDNKWHHVVAVWDGTTNTNAAKIFVDGLLAGQTTSSFAGPINRPDAVLEPRIGIQAYGTSGGSNVYGGNSGKDGFISNMQIWNTSLTYGTVSSVGDTASGQIAQLYNGGVPLNSAIEANNLINWYKFNRDAYFTSATDKWYVPNSNLTTNYSSALKLITKTQGDGNALTIYQGTDGNGPANLKFGATDSFSISTWIYVEEKNTSDMIFVARGSFGTGAKSFNRLFINNLGASRSDQQITWTVRDDNNATASVSTTLNTSRNNEDFNWTHVVAVVDRSAQTIQLFMNGRPSNTTNISSLGGFENQDSIVIGNDGYTALGGRDYYNGQISNFAIFGSALSQSQIYTLFNNGTPEASISHSPISWWKLDNLTTGIQDSAGGGNNITAASWITQVSNNVSTRAFSVAMTKQNLANNNVSVLNGESISMDTTNLVTSDLTRKKPFSNYSVKFDSADADYATTQSGINSILSGATSFTISSWVNFNDASALRPIATNWFASSTSYNYILRYHQSQIQFYVRANGSTGNATYSFIPDLNKWYNIVGTWNGSSGPINIYINGVAGGVQGTRSGTMPTITTPETFGRYVSSSTYYHDGEFSNVAYWKNQLLTQDDILNIYNNGVSQDLNNFRIKPTNWYPMDESYTYFDGTTLILRDAINNRDATGYNINQGNIVGNAPGSDANGTGTSLTIANLKGNMYNSINNSYSINMADYASGNNAANSGRSINVP